MDRYVYSGIVVAGLGVGMLVGPAVAAASPPDTAGASQSDSESDDGASGAEPSAAAPDTDPDTEDSDPEDSDPEDSDTDDADDADPDGSDPKDTADTDDTDPEDTDEADTEPADEQVDGALARKVVDEPDEEPVGTASSQIRSRPVTVQHMVRDVLTWNGLTRSADDIPGPATPVGAVVESLWLAVRQNRYTWDNQRPWADPTVDAAGPDGNFTGNLNAVDYDDTALTYHLIARPTYGRVVLDATGGFTYTPGAAAAGRADRFTVRIDDTSGNPFHVHGLLGLLGLSRPTEVTVTIAASGTQTAAGPPLDLDGLAANGAAITVGDRGGARVIDGPITDLVVVNADDAAEVLNLLAPALGAPAGFADSANITASRAGTGDTVEHFYRFTETVSGVTVLGSEIIVVTDDHGNVTSVFNYHQGLGETFDVTPDASVDEDAEIRLIAATAHLDNTGDPGVIEKLFTTTSFTKELVVYTVNGDDVPQLAWRSVIHVVDTGALAPSSATYLIDADGADAGRIIISTSGAHHAASVIAAKDWLGDTRSITVDTRRVLWFRTTDMYDSTRNITTYKTSYGFFGVGGPVLPGKVVKRSLFGWDTSAVSAHANTAVVYDWFLDVLGRRSWDDRGAPVTVSIRYRPDSSPVGYTNAFWDPTIRQFAYGDTGYLQAALDIVAHEYTHAVITSVVGQGEPALVTGEPGALNEAYADIFGVLVEADSDSGRWLLAEDSNYGVIRNLADPDSINTSYGPHRQRYSQRYTGKGDDGGVHVNSTIFSHAAYLMMTDASTSGVSLDTWARVFYGSLGRLGSAATFADGRAAVLSSAGEQGLTDGQRQAIAAAFDAVEIYGATTSSTVAV